jgi:hypothetical protein
VRDKFKNRKKWCKYKHYIAKDYRNVLNISYSSYWKKCSKECDLF